MSISKRLKDLRVAKGVRQEIVANVLNVSRSTYTKYETGQSKPSFESLIMLSKYFGVTVEFLLGVTDDPRTSEQIIKASQKGITSGLAIRLQLYRKQKGLSLYELGELSRIPSAYISDLENQSIPKPSASALHSIAEALDVKVFDLISDTPEAIKIENQPAVNNACYDYIVVAKELEKSGIPADILLEIVESIKKLKKR